MLYVAEYNRRCNCFRIDSLDEVVVKNRQAILAYEPLEWVSIGVAPTYDGAKAIADRYEVAFEDIADHRFRKNREQSRRLSKSSLN
jgi:hypothetical protein